MSYSVLHRDESTPAPCTTPTLLCRTTQKPSTHPTHTMSKFDAGTPRISSKRGRSEDSNEVSLISVHDWLFPRHPTWWLSDGLLGLAW